MKRTPEPELMDAPEQVRAYAGADFSEANDRFVADFLAALPAREAGRLIDLGCGPGDICLRLARALPGWHITGVDAGENMLAAAGKALATSGLEDRVTFRLAHLPDESLDRGGFDAVVSNSLLHHLPDPTVLWQSAMHLAAPGAWLHVMDLARPDSAAAANALVAEYAAGEPAVLQNDFRNSLHAAWTVDEVNHQLIDAGLGHLSARACSDRHWLVSGRLSP